MTLARPASTLPGVNTFTPVQLLRVARLFSADPDLPDLLPERGEDPGGRRWHQLAETHHLQLWVIEWPPGAGTGFHDHGGSRGAFTVVRGSLTDTMPGRATRSAARPSTSSAATPTLPPSKRASQRSSAATSPASSTPAAPAARRAGCASITA